MYRIVFHIVLFICVGNWSYAQTTFVPDANLRKALVSKLPGYLDANSNVIDAKASTYTGSIDCPSLQIKDLTGLWKFTGLTSLGCQNNEISNMDSLNKLTNLNSLYCFHNNIAKLPDLSTLTKLSYLSCNTNKLTAMPDLSTLIPLTYLDCSKNSILSIKGLDKLINIQKMIVYHNQLDSLPDLSKLAKLQVLMCHENNLRTIPGLSQLTQLTELIAGANKINYLPDMTNLTKLSILMVYNCKLTSMPNVSKMAGLTKLALGGNKIASVSNFSGNPVLSVLELDNNLIGKFPDISACKNTLSIVKIHNNQLDSIPDFSPFSKLDTLLVQNNHLTFEDVIPLAQNTSIVNIKYAPQDSVGMNQVQVLTERRPFRMSIGIDKKINGNLYSWYKNGKLLSTTNTDTLLISQVQPGDAGVYHCLITNPLAPLLTLCTRTCTLKVKSCIDLSNVKYATTDFDCNYGGSIKITDSSISGGQKPYAYKLISNETGNVHFTNGSFFPNIFESSYTLEVIDKSGCLPAYYNNITVSGRKGADCKSLVILGDESSPNNTLFLEEKGTAKVYDNEGQLVKSFSTPSSWDGRNKNGEFLPGYYVIDLNGKMLNVTLIK